MYGAFKKTGWENVLIRHFNECGNMSLDGSWGRLLKGVFDWKYPNVHLCGMELEIISAELDQDSIAL